MIKLLQHKWLAAVVSTLLFAIFMLIFTGELDVRFLTVVFVLAALLLSFPVFLERMWQSRNLPSRSIHVPCGKIRSGTDLSIVKLFDLPEIYSMIKNRYGLKQTDAAIPGIFLYIYLPSALYDLRNAGPEAIYRHIATRLQNDLKDSQDLDIITQRALPLTLGFRFLPKNSYAYHELSQTIDVVRKDYFRENTRIRGILQSKRRMFRIHTPEDNDWHTFQPYHDDTNVLSGGAATVHDFRSPELLRIPLSAADRIGAERVEYPEKIAFGSLLTYAKKGEIVLQGVPMAMDKLFIDRVNILMNGSEHRKEILAKVSSVLKREISEDDLYPLFNYGQRLQGYMEPGKTVSDFVSSRGNFAIYYDAEKGWTIIPLGPGLELRLLEAYWNQNPKPIQSPVSLTTSRATVITGSAESLLNFDISTGTPTRGQIFAADHMIESKINSFSQVFGFQLLQPVGTGAEGCLYLASKGADRFYLKSPDGQLASEEIHTIGSLKKAGLISERIQTYPEDRMIVLPEFPALPPMNHDAPPVLDSLIFRYLRKIWDAGFLCLDLTPEHVRLDPQERKVFLIDFSGYAKIQDYKKNAKEFLADRKKIEYKTPEETVKDFRDAEKLQIYLLGLLFYQIHSSNHGLPQALRHLDAATEYDRYLQQDLNGISSKLPFLKEMLAYDPACRKDFDQLNGHFNPSDDQIQQFWRSLKG